MFTIKSIYIHKGCRHLKNLKEETDYPLGLKLDKDFYIVLFYNQEQSHKVVRLISSEIIPK